MSASSSSHNITAGTHPVVLLARIVAAILGILAILAHVPALGIALAALTGYGVVLVLFRRSWNGSTTQAAKTG
ncbi:hypothetical protein [Streptomyces sp. NPDC002580]|uniref:hypothetical protein n=1 Tax=Streptomyces sp. NPDC002580 TaxID=3364653 RepID=UPI0036BE189D